MAPAIEVSTFDVDVPLLGMSVYSNGSSVDNVQNGTGSGSSSGGTIWNDAKGNLFADDTSWDTLKKPRRVRKH